VGALCVGALCVLSACGAKKADHSPAGVVKQFLAASILGETDKRHKSMYELLGPRSQARLKASADQATAATGGKRKYSPHEMLSASFRPGAKSEWAPKTFKALGKSGNTARVEVRGEKRQVQVVTLVKVKGSWRIELKPASGSTPAPKPRS
jgi:hypothetical protein